MKQIGKQDIEKLRKSIIRQHDLVLENVQLIRQVRGAGFEQMLERLEAADQQLTQLLELPQPITGQDPRVQALHRELNELRIYFGAPTGRPLEDRGVAFIAPFIRTLKLLFQISGAMLLYVEAVRTELALLEYRLERGQEYDFFSLADTISICINREHFTDVQDNRVYDLGHYLLLIHRLLHPLLFSQEHEALQQSLTGVYLEMAAAFSAFQCGPEELDESFYNSFVCAILVQLLLKKPNRYVAQRCLTAALWLLEYPLSPEQKKKLIQCCNAAKEVLANA